MVQRTVRHAKTQNAEKVRSTAHCCELFLQKHSIADKRIMYDHLGLHEETRKLHHRFLINNIANNYEVPNIPLWGC